MEEAAAPAVMLLVSPGSVFNPPVIKLAQGNETQRPCLDCVWDRACLQAWEIGLHIPVWGIGVVFLRDGFLIKGLHKNICVYITTCVMFRPRAGGFHEAREKQSEAKFQKPVWQPGLVHYRIASGPAKDAQTKTWTARALCFLHI